MTQVVPARHQPELPLSRLLVSDPPDAEAVEMDVVFVGGGPAGLVGAIELARLVKKDNDAGGGLGAVEIAVLEKGESLGAHSLSGAVVNPVAFRELFPRLAKAYGLPYVPFLLEGVAARPELNQRDGIHPNAEGQKIVARTVADVLAPLVRAKTAG